MCDTGYDFDGYCQIWRESPHQARKEYKCNGCRNKIKVGEPYLSHFDVYDGDANTERMCFGCWWTRKDFSDSHGQLFAPSMLAEMLQECIRGDPDSEWRSHYAALLKRNRQGKRT